MAAGDPLRVVPARADRYDDEPGRDDALIAAARNGDLSAFNEIVIRHERMVFAVCMRLLRDRVAAEDTTQDTFIRAWGAIHTFQGDTLRPWLLRIATNRAHDLLRARSRRPTGSLDAEPFEVEPEWTSQSAPEDSPEAHATRSELSAVLERALDGLPHDQRLAIILSDIQGYDYEEIAAITDVAMGTVKSRISRGRSRLRNLLQQSEEHRELFERFIRLTSRDESAHET